MRTLIRPSRAVLITLSALLCAAEAAAQPGRRVAVPRPSVRLADACTDTLLIPPEIVSRNNTLQGTLTMAPATYRIGGRQLTSNVYNGDYNAPTLRVGLGEKVLMNVVNNMGAVGGLTAANVDVTNQHYHGMVVTPIPTPGDNVTHVAIPWKGGSNVNAFPILPARDSVQSQGLMWYHPHPHGQTLPQVAGGLAGAMVVGDLLSLFPEYRGARERILVIKTPDTGSSPTLNINRVQCPRMTVPAGGRELWRVLNATGNTFLNLKLDGYTFTVLAFDGNRVTAPIQQDSLFVPPGGRVEAVITGGSGKWAANLVAAPFLGSGLKAPVKIGELRTVGAPREPVAALEAADAAARARPDAALADSIRRLATATDVETFTLRFSFGTDDALLNGRAYDPRRLDRAVQVGRVQEWTLVNETTALHTFHIHQTDFLVTEVNGRPVAADSVFFDNVLLGVHANAQGKTVGDTIKVRFKFHPVAVGPFVYHCHVLRHEDEGMMQNICVYPAGGSATCNQWFPGGTSAAAGHAH